MTTLTSEIKISSLNHHQIEALWQSIVEPTLISLKKTHSRDWLILKSRKLKVQKLSKLSSHKRVKASSNIFQQSKSWLKTCSPVASLGSKAKWYSRLEMHYFRLIVSRRLIWASQTAILTLKMYTPTKEANQPIIRVLAICQQVIALCKPNPDSLPTLAKSSSSMTKSSIVTLLKAFWWFLESWTEIKFAHSLTTGSKLLRLSKKPLLSVIHIDIPWS